MRALRRAGQALVFVLLFLIPMVLVLGLLIRVDSAITLKIRIQDATDGAALTAGSQVSRVMNQVALHNMTILKYHALQAATKTAINAADITIAKVSSELGLAAKELGCWGEAVSFYSSCCENIFCSEFAPCSARLQASQDCVQCLTEQVQQWQKILSFWTNERNWLQRQSQTFESQLGPLVRQMGRKSEQMVNGLRTQLPITLADLGRQHRLELNTNGAQEWLYITSPGQRLEPGQFDASRIFKKVPLSQFASIAMDANEPGGGRQVAGIKEFEGPPPSLSPQNVSFQKGQRIPQVGTWGATRYFLEYIQNVHFGLPGYFSYRDMHGPLGNPDTQNPTCGGGQHKGCEKTDEPTQSAAQNHGCATDGKPCHRDWKDYSRDYFRRFAQMMVQGVNSQEFGADDVVYMLADDPKLEFILGGKIEADQGWFNRLFKSRTVDMPDTGPRNSKSFLHALSKFELYNLTETGGQILNRDQYGQYPKSLLTQDWTVLMTPIATDEVGSERDIIRRNVVH